MAKITVSLPQGTRDFGPDVVRKRNYILNCIRNVFEIYGFQPLETPAMENLDTLMGKYGDEGDKLIFKILNNGLSDPKNRQKATAAFENVLAGKNSRDLTERALKYDLTIPFARYVAMNYGQLAMPFKRYQVQPVWRADRPQRGRYREFYQCDADIVGSNALINEVELADIYSSVFKALGVAVEIKINSRKILLALAALCGGDSKLTDITVAIDKLDKIGLDKVKEELLQKGLLEKQVHVVEQYLGISGTNEEKVKQLKDLLGNNEVGAKGIAELQYLLDFSANSGNRDLHIDFTLARGLNYYTGIIFEVKAKDVQMGSIGGGGRYDDLTGLFGVPNVPGVGISFGVDRIYDVMDELHLFPPQVHIATQVLFFHIEETLGATYAVLQKLRAGGVRCEIFHEAARFEKQFKYAEKKNIPFAVIIGTKELEEDHCVLRDLRSGEQRTLALNELLNHTF